MEAPWPADSPDAWPLLPTDKKLLVDSGVPSSCPMRQDVSSDTHISSNVFSFEKHIYICFQDYPSTDEAMSPQNSGLHPSSNSLWTAVTEACTVPDWVICLVMCSICCICCFHLSRIYSSARLPDFSSVS